MKGHELALGLLGCLVAPADRIWAQQSDSDSPEIAASTEEAGPKLESCFNARGMIDISVLNDQHMYVRTRGNNHYLITMELCEDLERSYVHRTARLVPYGREVCLNDGSYVLYENAGRQEVCPIRRIELVANRAQAREMAAGNRPIVELEDLPAEVLELPPEENGE